MLSDIILPKRKIPDVLTQSIDCLKTVFNHPRLDTVEKSLWLWLVSQGVFSEAELVCFLSYHDISLALDYSAQAIHRALIRLRVMGFLFGEIFIYYGPLSEETIKQDRRLILNFPEELEMKMVGTP